MRVYLGGTCNESTWRKHMIIFLHDEGLEWFDPVVDDWNEEAQKNELRERKKCNFCLYTITPKMTGVYAIAEIVDDSCKQPEKTVFVMLRYDGEKKFSEGQWKSLNAVAKMVRDNGGQIFVDLKSAAIWMGRKNS